MQETDYGQGLASIETMRRSSGGGKTISQIADGQIVGTGLKKTRGAAGSSQTQLTA